MTKEEETPISYPVSGGRQAEFKPLVSVIVPVYNVEPYLRRCINSLVYQTLNNIEIILIDDGSTDGCGKICDEYAAADARISVVHQENAGLSEARNAGIDRAKADYLMFVDSDDWVEPEFCELPLMLAKEQQADLVMFQFRRFQNGKEKKRRCYSVDEGIKKPAEALDLIQSIVGMSAWNKLYHKDLFQRNRYPKGKNYEDLYLTPILVHEAKKIVYSSTILYDYVKRTGSITTDLSTKNAQNLFDAEVLFSKNLKEWGYPKMSKEYYQTSTLSFVSRRWQTPELNDKCIQYLRNLKRCPSHFSFKQRIKYHLLVISPCLYRLVCQAFNLLRVCLVRHTQTASIRYQTGAECHSNGPKWP